MVPSYYSCLGNGRARIKISKPNSMYIFGTSPVCNGTLKGGSHLTSVIAFPTFDHPGTANPYHLGTTTSEYLGTASPDPP